MSAAESPPAEVFAALGDPTRLTLVSRLLEGEDCSITRLTEGVGLSRQGVTKHLRVLEQAGLVRSRRLGREQRYAVVPDRIDSARDYLDALSRQWDDALERLRRFVED